MIAQPKLCPKCGTNSISPKAKQCQSCYYSRPRRERRLYPICPVCGVNRLGDTQSQMCKECFEQARKRTDTLHGQLCPFCGENTIQNYNAKMCRACDFKSRSGENNSNWLGGPSTCTDCGKEITQKGGSGLCSDCYRTKYYKGLPSCKVCGGKLSRYDTSRREGGTGICQKCYRGSLTKRWNPNLESDIRENKRNVNPKYRTWLLAVFQRDNFKCTVCDDSRGGNLCAHHLNGFDTFKDQRFNVDNGVTLCEPCHRAFHRVYGCGGNTEAQFAEWKSHSSRSGA